MKINKASVFSFFDGVFLVLEFSMLVMAIYIAYQMYQYSNGWNDAIKYINDSHRVNCFEPAVKNMTSYYLNNIGR